MRILVTGGAGFMGSTLVRDLVAREVEVRVLDKEKGALADLKARNLEIFEGRIENREAVKHAMEDVDIVYHLAESYSRQPYEVLDIDVKGNINLLEEAAEHGIKHFLFSSTHRVYGKPRYLPINEEHPLNAEESGRALYAICKLANEKLCLHYYRERSLPITIFRLWWAFSSEIGGRALRNVIDTALKGGLIRIPEEAGGSFLHNDDLVGAFRSATLEDKAYGEVLNLSSGAFISWQELAQLVRELTDSSSQLELVPRESWTADVSIGDDQSIPYVCDLDITKAERLIGYKPKYSAQQLRGLLREAVNGLVLARKER
jgi:nucleoside-diphosphate-sugar epimerase